MGNLFIYLIIALGLSIGSCLNGANYVHESWKADAIERCSKIKTKEWCQGRAVLEKW